MTAIYSLLWSIALLAPQGTPGVGAAAAVPPPAVAVLTLTSHDEWRNRGAGDPQPAEAPCQIEEREEDVKDSKGFGLGPHLPPLAGSLRASALALRGGPAHSGFLPHGRSPRLRC